MKITCPHCSASLDVDPQYAGQSTPCPKCSNLFIIPIPTAGIVPSGGTNTKKIALGVTGGILGVVVVAIIIVVILLLLFTVPSGRPSALDTIREAADKIEREDNQP